MVVGLVWLDDVLLRLLQMLLLRDLRLSWRSFKVVVSELVVHSESEDRSNEKSSLGRWMRIDIAETDSDVEFVFAIYLADKAGT